MGRLTRAQHAELERLAGQLTRGLAFVGRADIALARVRDRATTSEDFSRPDGACLTPICKDCGSEFVLAQSALDGLLAFLANHG